MLFLLLEHSVLFLLCRWSTIKLSNVHDPGLVLSAILSSSSAGAYGPDN